MFDPISASLQAVSQRSAWAPATVALAGVVSSLGPCVAPRYLAVAGIAANRSRAEAIAAIATFVGGLVVAYAAFGVAASLLGRVTAFSSVIYAVVALGLAVAGIWTLARPATPVCEHRHVTRVRRQGLGAIFLLGASFAFVVSPCCTPLVAGILAYTSAVGDPLYGASMLGIFALAHALPVLAVGLGASGAAHVLERFSVRHVASIVSGTLMLGIAAYYAVLA